MKKLIIALYFLLFGILSCSTEVDEFMDEGSITGYDHRECACCGGYYIDMGKNRYRFYELPDNSSFNLDNPVFPIYVRLDWTKDKNACLGDEIIILRIEKK
jgi:hypothetical protein